MNAPIIIIFCRYSKIQEKYIIWLPSSKDYVLVLMMSSSWGCLVVVVVVVASFLSSSIVVGSSSSSSFWPSSVQYQCSFRHFLDIEVHLVIKCHREWLSSDIPIPLRQSFFLSIHVSNSNHGKNPWLILSHKIKWRRTLVLLHHLWEYPTSLAFLAQALVVTMISSVTSGLFWL